MNKQNREISRIMKVVLLNALQRSAFTPDDLDKLNETFGLQTVPKPRVLNRAELIALQKEIELTY